MLIQWRASCQRVVSMSSPSSGGDGSSVIGGANAAWSLARPFRRAHRGMWHPNWAAVSKNSVFGRITNVANHFLQMSGSRHLRLVSRKTLL
jgi:hypothetical protein